MNFKEILERYKQGKATAEERRLVESELEKYEAIEGHFSEQLSDDLFIKEEAGEDNSDGGLNETTSIKKLVNKRLAKVVMLSVLIVVLIYTGR